VAAVGNEAVEATQAPLHRVLPAIFCSGSHTDSGVAWTPSRSTLPACLLYAAAFCMTLCTYTPCAVTPPIFGPRLLLFPPPATAQDVDMALRAEMRALDQPDFARVLQKAKDDAAAHPQRLAGASEVTAGRWTLAVRVPCGVGAGWRDRAERPMSVGE